jgi:outer membrane protein
MKRSGFVFVFVLIIPIAHAQEKISLEQVIAAALEKNFDIRIAKNVSKAAALDEKYSIGALLPTVNGTGSMVWNENDQNLRVLNRETSQIVQSSGKTAANNLNASVLLNWTIFDGGRMFVTRERLESLSEQGELVVKDQIINTVASVTSNYYDVVRQKQQLRAILEQMSVSEERVKLAERKFQVGTGAKPELLQAKVDYNAQRAQALQQESVIEQLKAQLNSLVGMQLPPSFDLGDTILIDLSLEIEGMLEAIEENNPTLKVAKENLTIASLSVRERKAERYPFIDLNASYNYSRIENTLLLNPYSPQFNQTNGFNYGISVSLPIFNGLNQNRLIRQSRLTLLQQQLRYDQQKINISVAVQNAFTNYDNSRKVLLVEEENILLAKENVSIAFEVFRRGASTYVELRTAQQSLAEAYTRLINARYLAKLAETELLRLNGSLLK